MLLVSALNTPLNSPLTEKLFKFQMESEVNLLRRRYLDSVQSNKSMKQLIKVQKDKSRQLIVACAYKLQEKEAEIKNVSYNF